MKIKNQIERHLFGEVACAGAALLLLATANNSQAQYTYTTLSVPGAQGTVALGISGNDIVGYYENASGTYGFLYDGSTYTTLSVPGASATFAYGISGNDVAGYYYIGSTYQGIGFLYNGSIYTTLSVPGAQVTEAFGISGNDIVGEYTNGNSSGGLVGSIGFLATPVPEPSALALLAIGGAALPVCRRSKKGKVRTGHISLLLLTTATSPV